MTLVNGLEVECDVVVFAAEVFEVFWVVAVGCLAVCELLLGDVYKVADEPVVVDLLLGVEA